MSERSQARVDEETGAAFLWSAARSVPMRRFVSWWRFNAVKAARTHRPRRTPNMSSLGLRSLSWVCEYQQNFRTLPTVGRYREFPLGNITSSGSAFNRSSSFLISRVLTRPASFG